MENLKKYKDDLDQLIDTGDHLLSAIKYECFKERITSSLEEWLYRGSMEKRQGIFSILYQCSLSGTKLGIQRPRHSFVNYYPTG